MKPFLALGLMLVAMGVYHLFRPSFNPSLKNRSNQKKEAEAERDRIMDIVDHPGVTLGDLEKCTNDSIDLFKKHKRLSEIRTICGEISVAIESKRVALSLRHMRNNNISPMQNAVISRS